MQDTISRQQKSFQWFLYNYWSSEHGDISESLRYNHRPRVLVNLYLEAQANGGFDALGGSVALQTLLCLTEPLVWHLTE